MKKRLLFLSMLALLHIAILNQTDYLLFSFEFIAQGSEYSYYYDIMALSVYNILFNTAMMVMFISTICKSVSDAFTMHPYIFNRGGQTIVKKVMLKRALNEILFILSAKLIIYICYFIYTQDFTFFFFYDMLSTFLTLGIFSLVFILSKLSGAKDKIPLFSLVAGHMIALILSFRVNFFSVFTISTVEWRTYFHIIIPIKLCVLGAFGVFILLKNNPNQILGVKNND